MIKRFIGITLATCLLASAAHADPRKADDRTALGVACVTPEDALEVGTTIDRKLPNFESFLYEKIVGGECFVVPLSLMREDVTLVKLIQSEVNTDVWEVRTDEGRTLYVPYDKEPGI